MKDFRFTYNYYNSLIEKIISNGYSIANYHNFNEVDRPCILRHDVDYDVNKALEFSIFESTISNNLYSTYFFLVSSDFYNVFSEKTLKAIDKIISLGHEIGLHFDETKYTINKDESLFNEFINEELHILGKALGTTINTVSMHRPSNFALKNEVRISNVINSYSYKFFKDFKYISDSRMHWREDAFSVIESHKFDRLHILTHPFWYSRNEEETKDKIFKFIHSANRERYKIFSENFRDLNEYLVWEDVR